jgi:hypothetical protein
VASGLIYILLMCGVVVLIRSSVIVYKIMKENLNGTSGHK